MRGIDLRSQDKTAFMSDFVLFIYLVTFNIGVPTTTIDKAEMKNRLNHNI